MALKTFDDSPLLTSADRGFVTLTRVPQTEDDVYMDVHPELRAKPLGFAPSSFVSATPKRRNFAPPRQRDYAIVTQITLTSGEYTVREDFSTVMSTIRQAASQASYMAIPSTRTSTTNLTHPVSTGVFLPK